MSSDDEITKKVPVHTFFDSEAPTKKTVSLLNCPLGRHEHDAPCRCVCHARPSIYHQRECCTPCPECGFQVQNPPPVQEEIAEDEDPEA